MRADVKRYRWVALILGLLLSPFTSLLYLGRGARAFVYLVLLLAAVFLPPWVLPLQWRAALLPLWPWLFLLIYVAGVVDSYRIAGHAGAEFVSPWYSRWHGIVAVLLCLWVVRDGVRTMVIEPNRMIGNGMAPTLIHDDLIVVRKYAYGVRLPYVNRKIADTGQPLRGDVVFFRYPPQPDLAYVQRVIGIPGDTVEYRNKRLSVNEKAAETEATGPFHYVQNGTEVMTADRFSERLDGVSHSILTLPDSPVIQIRSVQAFAFKENCTFAEDGFVCKVPPGHYFTMQDNRDRSNDGRYWGFLPEANLVGQVVAIGWNRHYVERGGDGGSIDLPLDKSDPSPSRSFRPAAVY